MAESEDRIENLAGAILDGQRVDWAAAESDTDFDARLLDQLRVLATVADLHRLPPSSINRAIPEAAGEIAPSLIDEKYRIEGQLGHGGMGLVYRARHRELGKLFALKLVQPHRSHKPESVARFRIEAQALGRLNHPNIVQVTDFGVDSRAGPYLVMEYIEGITLGSYLKERRSLPLEEALPIFSRLSRALDHAHDAGILHRDLKPANVLLVPREDSHHDVKILDFGIARFVDNPDLPESIPESGADIGSDHGVISYALSSRGLTDPGKVVGTLEYIAPEILKGQQASSSADIYAFGVLIYEVLVGQRPFAECARELLSVDFHREPPLPSVVCSSLQKELDQAILGPLQRDPRSRPSHAREVVAALRDAGHAGKVRQWRQSELPKRVGLSAAVVILVLLLYPLLQKLPATRALENQLIDARFALQPRRPPDPRIVLISIDEATLSSDSTPLPEKADDVGNVLGRVLDAGARVVAIDLLLPEHWSRSEFFPQLILNHSTNVVLASYSNPDGVVTGPESVKGLASVALGPEKVQQIFGFVNLSPDRDGVVRTMPLMYRDQQGRSVPSFAARAAEVFMGRSPLEAQSASLWIDYSVDWTQFHRISWKDAQNVLATQPETFRDRLVLVGAEFAGSGDVYRNVPHTFARPVEVSGLVLQALTLNVLLEGQRIKALNGTLMVTVLCTALGIAVMAVLSVSERPWMLGTLAVCGVAYVLLSFLLFRWNHQLWPIVTPAAAFCLAIVSAALLRRKLPPFPRVAMDETRL